MLIECEEGSITIYEYNNLKNYCNNIEYYYKFIMVYNVMLYVCFMIMLWEKLGMFKNIDETLYDTLWELFKYYSYISIQLRKYAYNPLKSQLLKLHNNIRTMLNDNDDKIILIRDGQEIMRFKKINGLIAYYIFNKNIENDDLVCYRNDNFVFYTNINDFINDSRMSGEGECLDDLDIINDVSKIKFMTTHITVKLKNKDCLIQRSIDLTKFMLVGSKLLSKSFVYWYCDKYLNLNPDCIEYYKIDIIDQDVDQIEIDMNDYIEIHKNEYVIHKLKHNIFNDKDDNTIINELDKIIEYDQSQQDISKDNDEDEHTNDSTNNKYSNDDMSSSYSENYKHDDNTTNEEYNVQLKNIECEKSNNLDDEHMNSSWTKSFMLF